MKKLTRRDVIKADQPHYRRWGSGCLHAGFPNYGS